MKTVSSPLALLLLLLAVPPLSAQAAGTPTLDRLIHQGDQVQVTIPGTIIETAVVQGVSADSLHIAQSGQEWFLSVSRIQELSVRRSQTTKFGVRGAIAGLPLGALGAVFMSPLLCDEPGDTCDVNYAKGVLLGSLIVGTGLALLGTRAFEWHSLLP